MTGTDENPDQNQSSMGSAEGEEKLQKVLNDKAYLGDFYHLPSPPGSTSRPLLAVLVYLTYATVVIATGFYFLQNFSSEDLDNTAMRNLVDRFVGALGCIYDDTILWDCESVNSGISRTVKPVLSSHGVPCNNTEHQAMTILTQNRTNSLPWSEWSPCMVDKHRYRFKVIPFNMYMNNVSKLYKTFYEFVSCN